MKESHQIAPVNPRDHPISWRLTFSFSGEAVRLARRQRVEMLSPASAGELPKAGKHCGTWLELRDEEDRLLFVRRLYNPLQTLAEHHSPDGSIEVLTRPPGEGEFEVVVPALKDASSAVLVSSPLKDGRSTEPAQEVARFALREKAGESEPGKSDADAESPRSDSTQPPGTPTPRRGRRSS